MEELDILTVVLQHVVFRNEGNGYTVAKCRTTGKKETKLTVTGLMMEADVGETYELTGNYVHHPKYGLQFSIKTCIRVLPMEAEGMVRFLSGSQFPGIGEKTARKVVEQLGEEALSKIRKNPDVLYEVSGLSRKQMDAIRNGMQEADEGLEDLVKFLQIDGIGMRNIIRLNQVYGKDALDLLKENPYRVIWDIHGIGFATADKIAMSLGVAEDDERRLLAYLASYCDDMTFSSGDTYVLKEELEASFAKKLNGIDADIDTLLKHAVTDGILAEEEDRIYPMRLYEGEMYISSFLAHFPYVSGRTFDAGILNRNIEKLEDSFGITYDDHQKDAIHSLFKSPFLIMTGGPGTGKTTVVRAMVRLYKEMYPTAKIILCAPTGRAAKRLQEMTGCEAMTIHSLLQWDLDADSFGKNEEEPLYADLLIADEFSMVDNWLFTNLLKASSNIEKICVIGDEDQLPSVGQGCLLRDLIQSACFPVVRLNTIYRQEDGSEIIDLAQEINHGEVHRDRYDKDVRFFSCKREKIVDNVLTIVKDAVDKGYDIQDIQVLSPMYAGAAGIDVLNQSLQSFFNPPAEGKGEVRNGFTIFREGDKILQLRNQPEDDVYNGDTGTLLEVIPASHSEDHKTTITVRFGDHVIEYGPDDWNNITLAYCMSIHKAQGSEYPIVIMAFSYQHKILLQRKLIYTGITRARRFAILLGELSAFDEGINIVERHVRRTTLTQRLKRTMEEADAFYNEEL